MAEKKKRNEINKSSKTKRVRKIKRNAFEAIESRNRKVLTQYVPKHRYCGTKTLLEFHHAIVSSFEIWTKREDYKTFHRRHYDWFAFPIDVHSNSKGDAFKVSKVSYGKLIKNEEFLQSLRKAAILLANSWGYDLEKSEKLENRKKDQCWQNWSIRLKKAGYSCYLFGQMDLFRNWQQFVRDMIPAAEKSVFAYWKKNIKLRKSKKKVKK